MIDEDRSQQREKSTSFESDSTSASGYASRSSLTLEVTGTVTTASSSTDEDGHPKRRASPTELVPEKRVDVEGFNVGPDEMMTFSNLAKSPSFKKMRPAGMGMGMDNMSVGGGETGSAGVGARVGRGVRRVREATEGGVGVGRQKSRQDE